MPSYSIRPAARGDAATVAELHVATWKAAYKDLLPAEFLAGLTPAMRLGLWRDAIEYGEPQVLLAVRPVACAAPVASAPGAALASPAAAVRWAGAARVTSRPSPSVNDKPSATASEGTTSVTEISVETGTTVAVG